MIYCRDYDISISNGLLRVIFNRYIIIFFSTGGPWQVVLYTTVVVCDIRGPEAVWITISAGACSYIKWRKRTFFLWKCKKILYLSFPFNYILENTEDGAHLLDNLRENTQTRLAMRNTTLSAHPEERLDTIMSVSCVLNRQHPPNNLENILRSTGWSVNSRTKKRARWYLQCCLGWSHYSFRSVAAVIHHWSRGESHDKFFSFFVQQL